MDRQRLLRLRSPLATLRRCADGGRLALPADLPARLGYDAVGMPAEHGKRVMERLPRIGCVFADDRLWWWIVPAGSQIDVQWPSFTRYAVGAYVSDPSAPRTAGPDHPRLISRPQADSPYTPPMPLYFVTCRLAGIAPYWSLATER